MKFTHSVSPLALATSAVFAAGAAFAQQPIVIKFSHVVAVDTPKGKARRVLQEARRGAHQGPRQGRGLSRTASSTRTTRRWRRCSSARCRCSRPSLAKFGPLGVREFEVFDLPFIFDNYDELHKVTEGPVGKALLKKLEPKGIIGLAYWDNGFKVMSAPTSRCSMPADFKGLKMRIQSSKVLDAQMRALGAIPQVMAFSEVYQALQTGVVDGTENPPSNLYTQKMHEVQKYVTVTDHGYLGYAVIVNKKFWDGLPADVRTTLEGAMEEATKYANDIAKKENDDALEAVKASGKTADLSR